MDLKPIETAYSGRRFRSRLEARWAVFFDSMGIEWEYEPNGFALPSGAYLPDFWLPQVGLGCWFEVKGQEPGDREKQLARELAEKSDFPVYIFHGQIKSEYATAPAGSKGDMWGLIGSPKEDTRFVQPKGLGFYPEHPNVDYDSQSFCVCAVCGLIGILGGGIAMHDLPCAGKTVHADGSSFTPNSVRHLDSLITDGRANAFQKDLHGRRCGNYCELMQASDMIRLRDAYYRASSARFEFGEGQEPYAPLPVFKRKVKR